MSYQIIAEALKRVLPLASDRLVLNAPQPEDFEAFYSAMLNSRPELQRWMNWAKNWPDEKQCKIFFDESISHWHTGHRHLRLNGFTQDSASEMICSLGLTIDTPCPPVIYLSYWANTKFTGKGYTSEACKTVLKALFTHTATQAVITGHKRNNTASQRVIESCGFIPHVDPRAEFGYKMTKDHYTSLCSKG